MSGDGVVDPEVNADGEERRAKQLQILHEIAIGSGMRSFSTPERTEFRCREVYEGVNFVDKNVLEIGAGRGLFSVWATIHGARRVTAMEPEVEGSTTGYTAALEDTAKRMGLANLEVSGDLLQQFDSGGEHADIVLMYNTINHIDEDACAALPDPVASRRFLDVFELVGRLMKPGGQFIVADCSSRNFFGDLGLRAPAARSIEWKKHATPEVWTRLLKQSGFRRERLRWFLPFELRRLGPLVANRFSAYFLNSHFRMVFRYEPEGARHL
jgi:SAM-dependent methyltransferase